MAVAREMLAGLRDVYRERLRGVYLFGSRARGDHVPDSDVDVMIVLDQLGSLGQELELTSALASNLTIDIGVLVSRSFASESDWESGSRPLLAAARADAIHVL
jgi:uncharacterized protein